jgi:hypothetical protein
VTTKRKKSDIQMTSAALYPRAACAGIGLPPGDTPCSFIHRPSPDARQAAKDHAYYNPGHEVRVIQENVAAYYLPPLPETPEEDQ